MEATATMQIQCKDEMRVKYGKSHTQPNAKSLPPLNGAMGLGGGEGGRSWEKHYCWSQTDCLRVHFKGLA